MHIFCLNDQNTFKIKSYFFLLVCLTLEILEYEAINSLWRHYISVCWLKGRESFFMGLCYNVVMIAISQNTDISLSGWITDSFFECTMVQWTPTMAWKIYHANRIVIFLNIFSISVIFNLHKAVNINLKLS